MKRALLFLLLLLAGNTVFAQDYALLPDTGIRRYFTNSAGYLRGIRVDSVVQEVGYKRYVTFRTARGWKAGTSNNELADSNGACWIGKDVRVYTNGDWHFPNVAGDTILVKTTAKVGDTWTFHRDTSAVWTEAKILSTDTQTVFGVLDSVKRIGLTVKSGTVAMPANPISSFQLVLSKTKGFAQVPDLYLFPYNDLNAPFSVRDYWYTKLGATANTVSMDPLLFRDIAGWNITEQDSYNFGVGDVIYNGSFYGSGSINDFRIDTVTAKQDFGTYTTYTYNHWSWRRSANQGGPTLTVQHGITTYQTRNKLLFDTTYMPEEYYGGCYALFYIRPNDTSFCNLGLSVKKIEGDGCGLYVGALQYPRFFQYKKGLGLTYHRWGSTDIGTNGDDLYSYVKNGVSCGTIPSVPSGVERLSFKSKDFKLYPQPATTHVFLEASQLRYPATIRIQNLQGQLLATQELFSAANSISTTGLPAGLYLLSFIDAIGNSAVQKLLIEPK